MLALLMPTHFCVLNHHHCETMSSEPLSQAGFWCLLNVQPPKCLSHTIWAERRSSALEDRSFGSRTRAVGVWRGSITGLNP